MKFRTEKPSPDFSGTVCLCIGSTNWPAEYVNGKAMYLAQYWIRHKHPDDRDDDDDDNEGQWQHGKYQDPVSVEAYLPMGEVMKAIENHYGEFQPIAEAIQRAQWKHEAALEIISELGKSFGDAHAIVCFLRLNTLKRYQEDLSQAIAEGENLGWVDFLLKKLGDETAHQKP